MIRWSGSILAAAALAALLVPSPVRADPDEFIPCVIGMVKAPPAAGGNGLTKFVCKGTFALPSAGAAPGTVQIDVNVDGGAVGIGPSVLCSGLGNPAGAKGYKCSGVPTVPVVLIKTNVVKGIIKADLPLFDYGQPHPYPSSAVRVRLTTFGNSDQKRYCARFSAPLKNDSAQFKSKTAPAPSDCSPSGAFLAEDGGLL